MSTLTALAAIGWEWQAVQGWSETRMTRSLVAHPARAEECAAVLDAARLRGLTVCPRGAGYSYADMILNDGHVILDARRMARVLSWDAATGLLTAEPGVTIGQILQLALPDRWTLPACVGGMGVTLGGAIGNDVHGKDAWRLGTFGRHVRALTLLTADGRQQRLSANDAPELFGGVLGGLGLLGVVVEATIQLQRIPSPWVEVTDTPVRDVAEWMDRFDAAASGSDFAVAWVDAFARRRGLGRGILTTARWVDGPSVSCEHLARSLTPATRLAGVLPAKATWTALRPLFGPAAIRVANAVKHRLAGARGTTRSRWLFPDYNFFHNKIPDLKHVYRPHGMIEIQPLMPAAGGAAPIRELLTICQREGMASLLCGVKRHRAEAGALTYGGDGYSIGVDVSLKGWTRPAIEAAARRLYERIADWGGRVYLAKDELLPAELFRRMYPHARAFAHLKSTVDPDGLFQSDLHRRLFR
jgi:FAD/FMN-containing dehydrogenase